MLDPGKPEQQHGCRTGSLSPGPTSTAGEPGYNAIHLHPHDNATPTPRAAKQRAGSLDYSRQASNPQTCALGFDVLFIHCGTRFLKPVLYSQAHGELALYSVLYFFDSAI